MALPRGPIVAVLLTSAAIAQAEPHVEALRQRCRRLIAASNRQSEAVAACRDAVAQGRSPLDFRLAVQAIVSGPHLPKPDDLGDAWMLTERAKARAADQPWGYAAECDIARHLGDQAMLERCTADLLRVAPDHEETRRALALATAARRPWLAWLQVAALGLAGTVTVIHSALRRRSSSGRVATAATVALAVSFGASQARAEEPQAVPQAAAAPDQPPLPTSGGEDFPIDDADPKKTVPPLERRNARPLAFGRYLMEMSARADDALEAAQNAKAVRYFEALTLAVPDRSVAFSKLCQSYEKLGDLVKAAESCRDALGREGVQLEDYQRFAGLVLQKPQLTEGDVQDLLDVVRHLEQSPATRVAGARIDCELALRTKDRQRFEVCTKLLEEHAPNDARTLSYSWAFALLREDLPRATEIVERAERASIPAQALDRMKVAVAEAESLRFRRSAVWITVAVAGAILLALVALRRGRSEARGSLGSGR